jgi:RNA polymerase sigma factor (sigma-70 family)
MVNKKQTEFLKLYEPVHNRFERFCRARAFGEMEFSDLMNETLLIAYQKFHQLKSEEAFLAFLFGISRRVLSNYVQKKKAETVDHESELMNVSASDTTDRDAEVYLLHKAMAQLPAEQRESLILFEITGFSVREIAALHEASESAVKKRLERGRKQLAQILTDVSLQKEEVHHG